MKLTNQILRMAEEIKTPFLVIDKSIIVKNYQKIKGLINAEVLYSMKANSHKVILDILEKEGCGFDVASWGEIKKLAEIGVNPKKIYFNNPIKSIEDIMQAYKFGVEFYVYDSENEFKKLMKYAPKSKPLLRIAMYNTGSEWPLTKKFGVKSEEAEKLLKYSYNSALKTYGLTFHVGSYCLNKNSWRKALIKCSKLTKYDIKMINLGGGLPIRHTKVVPSIESIGKIINKTIAEYFDNTIKFIIEPGAGIVGEAGIIVTSVIGKAKRGDEDWLYLDVGVFNGLFETSCGIDFELLTLRKEEKRKFVVAGPSCDSVDVMFSDKYLPHLSDGDKVFIFNAGAYTSVFSTLSFCGFRCPGIYYI